MKKRQKILSILLICIFLSQTAGAVGNKKYIRMDNKTKMVREVPILMDGRLIYTKPMSFIDSEKSYTLVPIRFVVENLGAKVWWNQNEQRVSVVLGDKYVTMNIDSRVVYINGQMKILQKGVSPKLVGSSTMVPLRFLVEAFGFNVGYDNNLAIPIIKTKDIVDDGKAEDQVEDSKVIKICKEDYKGEKVLAIYNTKNPEIKLEYLSSPNRLVIDIMDSTISKKYGVYKLTTREIEKLRVSQFDGRKIYKTDNNIVRVVVDLNPGYRGRDIELVREGNKLLLISR